jgi:hypothetical protein
MFTSNSSNQHLCDGLMEILRLYFFQLFDLSQINCLKYIVCFTFNNNIPKYPIKTEPP